MSESSAPDSSGPSLRSQTARAVGWMMILKLAMRSLSLVSTLILVRLLSPQDFGLVAMAMVLIAMMDLISWMSLDVVLIHNQSAERKHYDTAWTFNVLFKSASAVILIALAHPAALYYDETRVSTLILVLAAAQFLSGFENIGIVNFRKNMQFDREFKFMFLRKLAGFLVTVPLAFLLRNYWALIIGQVFSKVFGLVASYVMESYRPRFSLAARGEIFSFSKWMMLTNIIHAIRLRAAELIVGRIEGARELGFFNISAEISNTPTTELVAPINRAVFPAYAKISDKLTSLRSGYLSVIAVIALVATPAGMGIAATAELLVPVALGEAWLSTIPLFAILATNGVVVALQTNIASAYMALGKPHIVTAINAAYLVVLLSSTIPATMHFGVEGAAWSFLGTSLLLAPVAYGVMFRTIQLPVQTFLANMWRPIVSAAVMFVATRAFVGWLLDLQDGAARLVDLLLAVGFGAALYTGLILLLWQLSGRPQGAESYVIDTVVGRLRRRPRGESAT